MSLTLLVVLIVFGILLLLLEVLVVPGTTVVGIIGFVLIIFSLYETYHIHGSYTGNIMLGSTLLLSVLSLILIVRSKTWKKFMLDSEITSKVNTIEENKVKPGDEGITVSRLAPSGKALIHGEFYEVDAAGEFVDPKTPITVFKVDGNKIYVKTKTPTL